MEHSFGSWVKHRRKTLDLTQQELAKRVGCSVSLLFKIEADERRPSGQMAGLLAKHLDIPPEQQALFLKIARQQKGIQALDALERLVLPQADRRFDTASPVSVAAQGRLSSFHDELTNNLPIPTTPLIGREHEVRMVLQQLRDPVCRLLTLTGPGGVGKTRLALEAAGQLDDAFRDGVYFVPLVGLTSEEFILAAIAEALKLVSSRTNVPKTQLFHVLRPKNILFVLDNLEHLLNGVGLLSELLEAGLQIKILATSRERLNLRAEWTFAVQGLPTPENIRLEDLELNSAAALFLQRARQAKVDFRPAREDLAAIQRICQLVEGLPLALELAAAWVRTLSCHEILQEIEENVDFLVTQARDVPQRHHSMRAVFDSSWHLLSDKEQQVLMKLSVFRGGFTREAAREVAGAALPVLSALVDKSLVQHRTSHRYDLHELIRQYAHDRLIQSGDLEKVRHQHLRFFLTFVEHAQQKLYGAEQIHWLDSLEANHDNLRAALESSLHCAETQTTLGLQKGISAAREALRLSAMLYFFWKRRSHWREGRQWLQRALALSPALSAAPERVMALNAAALLAVEQADTRAASQYAEENLRVSQEMGDPHSIANAFNTLGVVRWKQKDFSEARRLCGRGLALFHELGEQFAVADALHCLGHITINEGDLEAAQSYLDEGLSLAREIGNQIGYIDVLGDLGLLAYLKRDYATAQARLEDSLTRFRAAKVVPGIVSSLNRLGDLARCQGDHDRAGRLYAESLSLYREMGDLDEIPSILHNLGFVALHLGDPSEAMELFQEALSIQHTMGNRAGIAECLLGIAGVLSARGQAVRGARLLGAAEALRKSTGAVLWPANCIEYDRILASLTSALGELGLDEARQAGQELTLEQAVAEAQGASLDLLRAQ